MLVFRQFSGLRPRLLSYRLQSTILCTDFDKTLTNQDTIQFIVDQAIQATPNSSDRHRLWKELGQLYDNEMDTFLRQQDILDHKSRSDEVYPSTFQDQQLRFFLHELGRTDRKSVQRVIDERVLEGIDITTIPQASHSASKDLRLGVIESFLGADQIHVISHHWSGRMIEYSLKKAISSSQDPASILSKLQIHANTLVCRPETTISSGELTLTMQSPEDKEICMQRIREVNATLDKIVIYVGDSINDLLALLEADIGFIIGQDPLLLQVLRKYGVEVLPLDTTLSTSREKLTTLKKQAQEAQGTDQRVLFHIDDWKEIAAFLCPT